MGLRSFVKKIFKRASSYTGTDAWLMPTSNLATGKIVSPNEALTVSTVYRGINILANGLAMLPVIIYQRTADRDGKERAFKHPLWKLLRIQPNSRQDSFQYFHMAMTHILMRGNHYSQIIRNGKNEIVQLFPLNPDCVYPYWADPSDEDSLIYRVTLPNGKSWSFTPDEILHLRAMSTCGVKGVSVLDLGMQTVSESIAMSDHTAGFFSQGVRASGILSTPNVLSEDAARRLSSSFNEKYSGSQNAYKTILLEQGTTWSQISLTNEQSQLIESRKFTVLDFSRWFGVPPHKLYELSNATFSNIEHQALEFLTDSLGPWIVAFERGMTRQILRESEWDKILIEFQLDSLLRADIETRYKAYSIGKSNGFLNADEIRARENLNPLPDGKGQIYLEPLNMKPVGEEPDEDADSPNTPNGAPNPDPTADKEALNPKPPAKRGWSKVFQQHVERALTRELSARTRGNPDKGKMFDYIQTDFRLSVEGALEYLGKNDSRVRCILILEEFAANWVAESEKSASDAENWMIKRAPLEIDSLMGAIGFNDGAL